MAKRSGRYGHTSMLPWLTAKPPGETEKRFIQIGNSLLLDPTFRSLSRGAQMLYLCMALESGGKSIFQLSKGAAKRKYGCAPTSFDRYRRELEVNGFVRIIESETRGQYEANTYAFTDTWKQRGPPRKADTYPP